MIDHERLDQLIDGTAVPENINEEVFVVAFKDGWLGDDLVNTIESFLPELEKQSFEVAIYLTFGYALGQKYKQDAEEEVLELKKLNLLN